MQDNGPKWLVGNQQKAKRRYWEAIHVLWVAGFLVVSMVLFFVPVTQSLWLWVPTLLLLIIGGFPFRNGPGFLVVWDRYQHLTRQKKPQENDKTGSEPELDGKERRQKRTPPINAVPMEYYDSVSNTYTGVLYLPPRIADSSLIVSTGFDGALLGADEFFNQMDSVSESLIEAARSSWEPIGITQGFIRRPYDITRSREWQFANVPARILASVPGTTWQEVAKGKSPEAVLADSIKHPDRPLSAAEVLHEEMIQRDVLKQKRASDAYSFYGLTVPRPEDWPIGSRGDIRGLLSQQQLNDAPIVRLTKLVEQGLIANGVLGVHTLDEDGLNNHLRKAWDMNPKTLQAWNEGLTQTSDGKPFDPTFPWPPFNFYTGVDQKGLPFTDYGGTIHRIYEVTGLDQKLIRPRQLQGLFQPGYLGPADEVGYAAVLSSETVLSSDEVRAATRAIRFKKAMRRYSGADSGDRDESTREREEAELLENQRDAFDFGGSHGLNMNFYIALSVYGENDKARFSRLIQVDERFRLVARTARVTIRPLRLAPHMNRAFWTMFGATGMM